MCKTCIKHVYNMCKTCIKEARTITTKTLLGSHHFQCKSSIRAVSEDPGRNVHEGVAGVVEFQYIRGS